MATSTFTGKAATWLRRYGPPELLGTLAALLGATLAAQASGGALAAAVAANWAEALAYYAVIFVRDLRAGGQSTPRAALAVARAMLLEFGPAELLNLTLLRNASLLAGIALAPSLELGVIAGKLVADLFFYLPTIVSFELLGRVRAAPGRQPAEPA
jgi:hypothetical protein